jgi:phosphate transport system substrate-binding protein
MVMPAVSAVLHSRLTVAIIVPIIVVAVAWLAVSVPRWRRISWREQLDTPIGLLPKEARQGARLTGGWGFWTVLVNQQEVVLPSLVLVRIRNTGLTAVAAAGTRRPITFTFPDRDVVEYAVTDCRGISGDVIAAPGAPAASVVGNRIILPRFAMPRRASFKLLVLLSGPGRGVLGKGRLRGGQVVRETRRSNPRARNIAFGTALALLVGAQFGVAVGEGPAIPSSCRSGHLVIQGSTAFAPAAQQIAQAYTSVCRDASISVTGTATFNGLNAVNNSVGTASANTVQVAMSDGTAPAGYSALVGHPVALIIFAVVVNRQAHVFNLTTAQLRAIFQGDITNWQQAGGPSLPISIVSRASTSGTRHTFDSKILGGATEPPASSFDCKTKDAIPSSPVTLCEVGDTGTLLQRVNAIPGAIGYAQTSDAASYANVEKAAINGYSAGIGPVEQGVYSFWTVEHLYTYGQPAPGSLTAAFLAYMNSVNARDILRGDEYTPCGGQVHGQVAALCTG